MGENGVRKGDKFTAEIEVIKVKNNNPTVIRIGDNTYQIQNPFTATNILKNGGIK